MPPTTTTTLHQNEIPGVPGCAIVHKYSLETVTEMAADFHAATLSQVSPCAIGVSVGLALGSSRIRTLVISTLDDIFTLVFHRPPSSRQKSVLRKVFSGIPYLTGFELPYSLIVLSHTLGFDISGYDLTTINISRETGSFLTPGTLLNAAIPSVPVGYINKRWDSAVQESDLKHTNTLEPDHALRAWFTAIAANTVFRELSRERPLRTKVLGRAMLRCLVDLATRSIRLDLLKPLVRENDFTKVRSNPDGLLKIENARYKTRIRMSEQTRLELYLENGGVINARVKRVDGRHTSAVAAQKITDDSISRILVLGREERTPAEQSRYRFLKFSLTKARSVPLFVKIIWFQDEAHNDGRIDLSCSRASHLEKLNSSQRQVATAMLSVSSRDSLVIAHGPPGTGKTTTISAAATTWVDRRLPCWIIAQSNVGVKNIAETLFKRNVKFRLLVSKEFLFGWHEEMYKEMNKVVIPSDQLPKDHQETKRMFPDINLILSTISMLSNPKLDECGLFDLIPVRSLVIDEASQIDVFEFMHLFYKFSHVLMKVCFFGDPKQLPPYGASEANLQTIFDVKHLSETSYFLNTQYRLPVPLGEFISQTVYGGKLLSKHDILDHSCVVFIDVNKGKEVKQASSYKNMEEVHMVVRVAKQYHRLKLNFCIITFYDPQRAAITKALKAENLPSGCVYNVDSYQGNESDFVILSSVRTRVPGFLKSLPRTNVALTRCRKGMVVVTNKRFLQGSGKSTLLGKLCRAWSEHGDVWIDWKLMLGKPVGLPGMPLTLPSV